MLGRVFEPKKIIFAAVVLAVVGATMEIASGIWDGSTHLSNAPESFWSPQHIAVYSAVGMIVTSAFFGLILILKGAAKRGMLWAIVIMIAGALMQLSGGYADSISHEIYGIDGVVSSSHLLAESGLILSSVGGFLLLTKMRDDRLRKLQPLAIMNVISSSFWVMMNVALFLSPVILCAPVHFFYLADCAVA